MLFDLSDRAKFVVSGADALRFLNGQLTNDIAALAPGQALYACALTVKGKLCADLYVTRLQDTIYLDCDPVLRDTLRARLERYIIADDAVLEEADLGLIHWLGRLDSAKIKNTPSPIQSNRFGIAGVDFWFSNSEKAALLHALSEPFSGPDETEVFRIERGIPRWGTELSESVIPNEAGLQDRAISYTKGCYVGQEVISRIKSIGHVNRHLCGLVAHAELDTGDQLFSESEGKPVGNITSVCQSAKVGGTIALAYIRRGFDEPGSKLEVRRDSGLIGIAEVRSLPFITSE
jgi:folate-binding protein YgfZ